MIWALIVALLIDAVIGEPRSLWERVTHPAVMMGRAIGWADRRWNTADARKIKGAGVMAGLVALALIIGYGLSALPGYWAEVVIGAVLIAQRSLADHVRQVGHGLRLSLGDGRLAVSNIVSRDTAAMTEAAIARSAIESGAENLSDGVIAPAFWFAIGGLPGLLVYKVTNTADSMIGYRTPRHEAFGWAAARFDDLLNLIPARLTAGLIWAIRPSAATWTDIRQDAAQHRSPNAGYPEAAMARVLNVSLAGPRSYDGKLTPFAYVNEAGRKDIGADEIDDCIAALWKAWGLFLAVLIALAIVI